MCQMSDIGFEIDEEFDSPVKKGALEFGESDKMTFLRGWTRLLK
jgi:hypothetical protein